MKSVLLIRPLCAGDEPEFAEPLGIERIAGFLRAHGASDVRVFDRRLFAAERKAGITGEDAPAFFECLQAEYAGGRAPDVVGLSLMTAADIPDARRIITRLRSWWPKALFTAGGVYATCASGEVACSLPQGVVLLRGEGERQLLALASDGCGVVVRAGVGASAAADAKAGVSENSNVIANARLVACGHVCAVAGDSVSVADVATAERAGTRSSGGVNAIVNAETMTNTAVTASALDSPDDWAIPFRPDLERYVALGCAVNVHSSRGCPGSCSFCATPALPPKLRRWQPRSIGLVVDEIEQEAQRLQVAGLPAAFNFVDDDFGPLTRVEALAAELARRKLRIAFSLEMRLASLATQPKLAQRLSRLREAGLSRIFFGLESLNPATLARWRKPDVLAGLPDVLDAFRAAGVDLQVGYILWHGAQTVEGARAEVAQLHDLGIYTHQMAISRLIVFPGCALGAEGASGEGFQPMSDEAESFHRRFAQETSALASRWTALAIQEPTAAAQALLTGQTAHLASIRAELHDINEQSFEAFMR